MNVLFLDVDGVLNSIWTTEVGPTGYRGIEDTLVERLSSVVKEFDMKIVLSSDWRISYSEEDVKNYRYLEGKLAKYGMHIYSETPIIRWDSRSEEVLNWIASNDPNACYVAVDDVFKIIRGIDSKHKIITSEDTGLTEKDINDIKQLMLAQIDERKNEPSSANSDPPCA